MKCFILSVAALCAFVVASRGVEPPGSPITLKIVAKTDKYTFDGGGKTPAEYQKYLKDLAKDETGQRKPKPPAVDLVLTLTNTSKEEVTIFVGGDPNIYTFELTGGAGVVTMNSGLAMTADFRLPKAVTLAAGKSFEIPVKQLSDGSRGMGRYVYWTGPGEYKLSATYTLADKDGGKSTTLKSEPVKITVAGK